MSSRSEAWSLAYARWLVAHPFVAILLALGITAGAAAGIPGLGFSNDYEYFFQEENPQLVAFLEYQKTYTKRDNLLVAFRPAEGEVFQPDVLRAIREFSDEAWKLPYAIRVDSIANFQHTYAEDDDLIVRDLVPRGQEGDPKIRDEAREVALREPLLVKGMIAEDGRTAVVDLNFQLPDDGPDPSKEILAATQALRDAVVANLPGLRGAVSGSVGMNASFTEAMEIDLVTLYPLMYGLLIAALAYFLRSPAAVAITIVVITLADVGAFGVAGWTAMTLTPPSLSSVAVILTVAVADCVHLLVTALRERAKGSSKEEAVVESLRVNMQPVFLTSLTTVIGFLSLNLGEVPPFVDFGNVTAAGVVFAWLHSVLLLPALAVLLPMSARHGERTSSLGMARIAEFAIARRRGLLLGGGVAVVAFAALIPRTELNDEFVTFFDESMEFRRDSDFLAEHLGTIYQLYYSLPAGEAGGISDPKYLDSVDRLTGWLREHPKVQYVASFADVMKRLNKNLHADDEAWFRVPEERELAAQYLLLYEMSLPYGLDLNDQIDVDKSQTRLMVTAGATKSSDIRALNEDIRRWLAEHAVPPMEVQGVGPAVMFANVSYRNVVSSLQSSAVAIVLISLVLAAVFRSFRLGFFSLIANLVPVTFAFGIWAVVSGQMNIAAATVIPSSIGIIVDNTVHFLTKYLRARRALELSPTDAVRYAFDAVGAALLVTAVVLAAGFSALAISAFTINATLGMLMAIVIVAAILTDFFLLPPVLILADRGASVSASGGDIPVHAPFHASGETQIIRLDELKRRPRRTDLKLRDALMRSHSDASVLVCVPR